MHLDLCVFIGQSGWKTGLFGEIDFIDPYKWYSSNLASYVDYGCLCNLSSIMHAQFYVEPVVREYRPGFP